MKHLIMLLCFFNFYFILKQEIILRLIFKQTIQLVIDNRSKNQSWLIGFGLLYSVLLTYKCYLNKYLVLVCPLSLYLP